VTGSINTNLRGVQRIAGSGSRWLVAGGLNAQLQSDGKTVALRAIRQDGKNCTQPFAELTESGIDDMIRFLQAVKANL